ERLILVRTPPGYERNQERYPVLYLTDGDAHLGHTSSTIEFLARNGRIPEMIVIAITNTNRTRDLTPTRGTLPSANGRAQEFPQSGGADQGPPLIEAQGKPHGEATQHTTPPPASA